MVGSVHVEHVARERPEHPRDPRLAGGQVRSEGIELVLDQTGVLNACRDVLVPV